MEIAVAAAIAEENLERQLDEVEALRSILGEDEASVECTHVGEDQLKVSVQLPRRLPGHAGAKDVHLVLTATLSREYPSHAPPKLELTTTTGASVPKAIMDCAFPVFANIFADACGEVMLFDCISWLEEKTESWTSQEEAQQLHTEASRREQRAKDTAQQEAAIALTSELINRFVHGEILIDRKSVFQAHLASLTTVDELPLLISALKTDRKIGRATHNIVAWRCGRASDNDDDGESAAGRRLAELLVLSGAENVLVVV